jgi:hypothetical protein
MIRCSSRWLIATLFLATASKLCAQVAPGTQIQTTIRPIVWTQYSGGGGTSVAIFDTGDPSDTLSRETALADGLVPITPVGAPAGFQDGVNFGPPAANVSNHGTTAAQNITSGGWFGAGV